MATCTTLNPVDITPVFPTPAKAHRKRPFIPVDLNFDAEFASLFPTDKKVRFEDYIFTDNKNDDDVVQPIPGHRKRHLEAVEEEFDLDFDFNFEPRVFKKVRSEDDYTFKKNPITTRDEWVNVLVKEMMSASSTDDARVRGAYMFEEFEETFAVATEEDEKTEEKLTSIAGENAVLKRAVAIQDKRLKKFEETKNQEILQLKELAGKYEAEAKSLEMKNYGLNVNLQQAMRPKPTGINDFRPDIF